MNEYQKTILPIIEEKWDRTHVVDQLHCWFNEKVLDPEDPIQGLSYVKDWIPDISSESDKFIIGVERPEDIKQIAREWNSSLISELAGALRALENATRKEGFSQPSEFVESSQNALVRDCYFSWNALTDAISMVNNNFVYGGDKIIFWNGDWTMVNDAILADVNEHTEMWVMLEVAYD